LEKYNLKYPISLLKEFSFYVGKPFQVLKNYTLQFSSKGPGLLNGVG